MPNKYVMKDNIFKTLVNILCAATIATIRLMMMTIRIIIDLLLTLAVKQMVSIIKNMITNQ